MSTLDYLVLAGYLAGMLFLGWWCRDSVKSSAEYFLAGRRMGWVPIGLSVMVTSFSAINFLALPGEVFAHGCYVLAALPIFALAAYLIARFWLPVLAQFQLTSLYEILEIRYDVSLRRLASGLFLLWRFFWMALLLYASGQICSKLTNFPLIPVILLSGVVATLYTAAGGLRAVMWSDVIQFFVLLCGVGLALYCAVTPAGLNWEQLVAAGRFRPFYPADGAYFSFDPTLRMTLWSTLIGVTVAFLCRYGADQMITQRYFAGRDLAQVRRGLYLNALCAIVTLGLLGLLGLALYGFTAARGELGTAPAAALARLIKSFPPGMTGVMLAALLAATMSSIDSGINSCAAAWSWDFAPQLPTRVPIPQWVLTAVLGLVITALAAWVLPCWGRHNSIFMLVNKFVNGLGSPLLALVFLAMFSRRVNRFGLFYGTIGGVVGSLGISLWVQPLAVHYYAVANLLVTMFFIALLSAGSRLVARK